MARYISGTGSLTNNKFISGSSTSSDSSSGTVHTAGNDLELSGTAFSLKDNIDVKDIKAVDISGLGLYNLSGNGIIINNSGYVGINLSGVSPEYHLDVSGNVRITGNLTVSGDTIKIITQELMVEDKNIILGDISGSGSYSDDNIQGGGITLKGASDKTLLWSDNKWNLSGGTLVVNNANVEANTFVGDVTGNADTATKIASITNSDIVQLTSAQTLTNKTLTSPTITGTGAIAGVFTGDVTGNADTATALATARTIGGVSFDGTSNINLPGVNVGGDQDTTGSAATVTGVAQTAITSVGTLTALAVDNLSLDGNTITSTGALNLTPAAGSAIVLDGTINVDAGVVTGATSITSTELTGDTLVCNTTLRSNQLTTATSDDLLLKRNTTEKIRFGNALTTIEDNCRFKKFMSIGDPLFYNSGTESTTYEPVVPLMIGAGSQLLYGNTITGNLNDYNYRRYFHPTSNYTGDSNPTGGSFSIYAEGFIVTKTYIMAANGSNFTSDDRFKTCEQPVENATETLMKLKPKTYMKHTEYEVDPENEDPVDLDASGNKISQRKETGLIAQEVLTQVPELSHIVGEHWDIEKEKFILHMDYIQLIPYLIKSNQELNERIKQLEIK